MKRVKGDLIALALGGHFDVIVHGCNCFCAMGGGIARTIKDTFPEAFGADAATEEGSRDKLGTYTKATIIRGEARFVVVNAYTQYHFGGGGCLADYDAIQSVFKKIRQGFPGKRIGYPLIGAGLAGGDWEIISEIIDGALEGEDHTLVEFVPES